MIMDLKELLLYTNQIIEYDINDETTEGYMCFDVNCKKKNPR
jgi:hypothetical protein